MTEELLQRLLAMRLDTADEFENVEDENDPRNEEVTTCHSILINLLPELPSESTRTPNLESTKKKMSIN
ncbi:hypothetical protein SNEBB_008163 [Seison nebaliae]|nr:hypothetical protein SNEBB_008163 [Seison nebaliae]